MQQNQNVNYAITLQFDFNMDEIQKVDPEEKHFNDFYNLVFLFKEEMRKNLKKTHYIDKETGIDGFVDERGRLTRLKINFMSKKPMKSEDIEAIEEALRQMISYEEVNQNQEDTLSPERINQLSEMFQVLGLNIQGHLNSITSLNMKGIESYQDTSVESASGTMELSTRLENTQNSPAYNPNAFVESRIYTVKLIPLKEATTELNTSNPKPAYVNSKFSNTGSVDENRVGRDFSSTESPTESRISSASSKESDCGHYAVGEKEREWNEKNGGNDESKRPNTR
jgi:hypothetical protein